MNHHIAHCPNAAISHGASASVEILPGRSFHNTPNNVKTRVLSVKKKRVRQAPTAAHPVGHLHIDLVLLENRRLVLLASIPVGARAHAVVPQLRPDLAKRRPLPALRPLRTIAPRDLLKLVSHCA